MKKYVKSIIAVIGAVILALVTATTDNVITHHEWINVSIAAVTAGAVFAAPNVPGAKYTKAVLAALGAVLVALASFLHGGINTNELLQLAIVGATAAGVYQFPNTEGNINISETGALGVG